MAPNLLSLPSEVRNTIYRFALTEPKSIYYRENESTAWRLCLHTSDPKEAIASQREIAARRLRRMARGAWVNNPSDIIRNPPMNSVETQSAKTTQGNKGMVTFAGHIVANQLRYVCRQLYDETKGLVTHHNAIEFTPTTVHQGQTQINRFLQACPPIQKHHIRTLIVRPDKARYPWEHPLLHLAASNPTLTLNLHVIPLPSPPPSSPIYIFAQLLQLKYIVRGDVEYFDKYPDNAELQRFRKTMTEHVPRNVRLFPWEKRVDEDALRRTYLRFQFRDRSDDPLGGMNRMVSLVKDWYRNGI